MNHRIETFLQTISEKFFLLFLAHVFLGIVIYRFPEVSKIYAFVILFGGLFCIVKNRNANQEVLFASAYVVGSEVFLRMTHGNPNHEFGKYAIILFAILGIYYSGFFRKATPYWIFILLLLPGVAISVWKLHIPIHRKILFDISGPLSLAIFSIYTYRREITLNQVSTILLVIGLPIIACCTYVFLFNPNAHNAYFNMQSSFLMSGNFGPNQVATILGLGMFIFFTRLILKSDSILWFIVNLLLLVFTSLRGWLTFSRGGMITGLAMIFLFLILLLKDLKYHRVFLFRFKLVSAVVVLVGIFFLASYESDGLIVNRYTNKNIRGDEKKESDYSRKKLLNREVNIFLEHPILGAGVGKGKVDSIKELGKKVSSHNELARMLSEHGLFGIAGLLILIIVPLALALKNKISIFFLSFYIFWLLTIIHTGMRIAAPAFLYALSLLHIRSTKE